jgi:cyclopropane fatty-acyl-phospholipid synthase-like methyltransferase
MLMSNWTDGYVADIGYTYGYYGELSPERARFALLSAGYQTPEFGTACELGFGQGLSVNIHAAASATQWFGTDFNPSQAAFARQLAAVSGSGAQLFDDAFAEFEARQDLPDFDYIGLHGIWSWVSDENRRTIVDFIRRKLKVGGVVFVSYNTLPGWAQFAPMRHLLREHERLMGSEGQGIVQRIETALAFGEKLLESKPGYARSNPQAAARLDKIKTMSRNYLAHEYFNQDWQPMYFSDMAEYMASAKLNYAGSAHTLDYADVVNFTTEQQQFMASIADPGFRETVRDYMVNQQFRRDIWVKGPVQLGTHERGALRANLRVLLITPVQDVEMKVSAGLGDLTLKDDLYNPLLAVLADHQPHTIAELAQKLKSSDIAFSQLWEMVLILYGIKHLAILQDDDTAAQSIEKCQRLNRHLLLRARQSNEISHLASPLIAGGIGVSRFQQLFLLARENGAVTPLEWAQFAWSVLQAQNERLMKQGKVLHTPEENLEELRTQAEYFQQKVMPILKAVWTI